MRAGLEMRGQIPGEQGVQVNGRAFALVNTVRPVWIDHEIEGLPKRNQPVHEPLGALVVHVVVARAMHDEQTPAQSLGCSNR